FPRLHESLAHSHHTHPRPSVYDSTRHSGIFHIFRTHHPHVSTHTPKVSACAHAYVIFIRIFTTIYARATTRQENLRKQDLQELSDFPHFTPSALQTHWYASAKDYIAQEHTQAHTPAFIYSYQSGLSIRTH
ncbi:hypothetical protein K443DRAFT_107225, partial [Laccaria amethystina LaAM-08-1]